MSVDNSIASIGAAFREKWNPYLKISPHLVLDGRWPSTAVLDLLSFGLRLKPELSRDETALIKGCSCYLGLMAYDAWKKAGLPATLRDLEEGVVLETTEGAALGLKNGILPLEKEMRRLLFEVPYPSPVIKDQSRLIAFDANIVSLFAIGVMTGLSPSCGGDWKQASVEEMKPLWEPVVKELARQAADNYAAIHGDEPWGQVAELYLNGLIFPPVFCDEGLPAIRAVNALLDFFAEYKISIDAALQLAHNLALSVDDTISTVGIALYGALTEDFPPPEIAAASELKGKTSGLLRRAMLMARERLCEKPDWVGANLKDPDRFRRLEIERALSFLPWLYLSSEYMRDQPKDKFTPLVAAMCNFDLQEAMKINDELIEETPGEIEIRLQRIKLEILGGDYEKSDSMFRSLFSEPGADQDPRFFNLWGLCLLNLQKADTAMRYFKAGLAIAGVSSPLYSDLANNYAWSCMLRGDLEKALELVELALPGAQSPVTILLNKASILWQQKRFEEVLTLRKTLFRLAPQDRRVFSGLTSVTTH